MSNDPRDLDGQRLRSAMHRLGRDPALRAAMLALLKRAEGSLDYRGPVRDDITGPIADALHGDDDRYQKTLADGTQFRFLFRTKIARDFLMSETEHPTHVWEPQTTRLLLELSRGLARRRGRRRRLLRRPGDPGRAQRPGRRGWCTASSRTPRRRRCWAATPA